MLLAEVLSTESDAHILDEIIAKILTHKADISNSTAEPMVGKNSNKRMPQMQTELPISAENPVDKNEGQPQKQTELPISAEDKRSKAHFFPTPIAPNDVTPQYHNEHSNDVPVQMPPSNGKPQQYVCKTCGQDYKSIIRFTEHLRRHSGEKPYGMLAIFLFSELALPN